MPPPRALARPLYGSPGPSASSSAGSASGAPAQGGNNPPHPTGPSPATPGGIPSSLPHTAKPPPPTRAPGVAQFPPTAQPTPLPPLRRWGFRGAAATAPPAGPGTHQLLCVFHQALMGRNRLLPLHARPRGLGAPSTRGWGRDRRCRGGQSSSAAPSAKNRPRPTAAAGTSTRRRTGAQAQTRPRQDRASRGGPTAISSPPWAKSFVTGGERSAPRRGPRRVRAAMPARE